MPKVITIDSLEPGIVLAEPVLNTLGQTLINSGISLTAKHVSILRTWNIHFVSIITNENEEVSELSEAHISHAKNELMQILTWKPRNSAEDDLIALGTVALAYLFKEESDDRKS